MKPEKKLGEAGKRFNDAAKRYKRENGIQFFDDATRNIAKTPRGAALYQDWNQLRIRLENEARILETAGKVTISDKG